jgi:hypothetical protein
MQNYAATCSDRQIVIGRRGPRTILGRNRWADA